MKNYYAPDENGFFGEHGGLYVSETLIPALQELAEAYKAAKEDPSFWEEFRHDLKHYVGRPSPVSIRAIIRAFGRRTNLAEA